MKTRTVSSGSYVVSSRRPEVLQAFLGSCVGVTLCDRAAGIGGLIHLLLPEPPSMDANWNPQVSAATGLPIFIAAMCSQGAQKRRLEACIGGGALIDPVSRSDLMLDIGGRTAEIVQQILDREEIPIRQSEVGGYFSCCIGLNLMDLETKIQPAVICAPKVDKDSFQKPSPEQLDRVIESLSPIPQTALKLIRMINNAQCTFHDISREVIQDQVISARIIRLCNSVSMTPGMRIDSIEKALLRIGEKNLLLLAISFSFEGYLSSASHGYSLCKGGLFHHSVWTANISSKLAEITGKASPDVAYTAGLLHDIGKVVLDQFVHDAYPFFYRHYYENGSDLTALEKELFGMAHTDAGHRLATIWGMPEFITDTIRHHHDPENASCNNDLARMVYIADLVSSRFLLGHEIEKMDAAHLKSGLAHIGLKPEFFPLLLADIPTVASGLFD